MMLKMPPSTFKQEFRQIILSEEEERFCVQIGSQELPRCNFCTKWATRSATTTTTSVRPERQGISSLPAMLLRISEADSDNNFTTACLESYEEWNGVS